MAKKSWEKEFIKEQLGAYCGISDQMFVDEHFEVTKNELLMPELWARLTAYVYSNIAEDRDIEYYCPRPTFLDWILRRRKKVIFNLKVKDLLINPPKDPATKRIYIVSETDETILSGT